MKIVNLGLQDYRTTWEAMKAFTAKRQVDSEDELWIVEHPAVFTQGISGKAENLLQNSNIPVVQSDRGGQITYHGPGQLLVYCLIDLKRLSIGVKKMVSLIETAIMDLLKLYDIESQLKDGAPGVYVQGAKIAALGLKVKNGATYHGLSLNVDMDLSPFSQINPCGYQGLAVTQLSNLTDNSQLETVANKLTEILINHVARS
ncbi:lipoyl(octanoyl) transferase LipB [bacterium endosymbiont of Bathymodiolus sp. 5 South]|jgi:lipoyl(octanoyl) transferase|uniref:lipoyl(octanoyl) transferase LipB n=1 Tax=bacterium endosymbiont of Bathymodiolus sp. 5 South TaxID=1181670 RepID=UPI000255FD45|nr:lipoyl(octanoyl) transferase LipB [bacterium endosymbiont of Bathymodiolus sp. 5 South]CAC9435208.1 Octanoate-[acyl-carrier-protein]-protein-N-octanoyltransferase (EC 2.3.1.181) [uncultured Gammaproteobacteria bacterium]CAC9447544.1 Octanoate-[acyl-carrier-protein]-protein-N-octanoyltransferase (EC 2.3.1.181) [uncultured Gammaproteobacteria bacterium]CAC9472838.1 Octanoate-[acyl-carrier-protein]-protein-N-octanoyltransferase (EC 2.3.1.181) [uncultured Gammaproteobacteria bacterium]CAC9655342